MKKTEKIELRVDHAEKERLSGIAERRGQTVSDVVRDALASELGTSERPVPRWPGWMAIAAVILAFTALATNFIRTETVTSAERSTPHYPDTFSVRAYTDAQDIILDMPLHSNSRRSMTLKTRSGRDLRLVITARLDSETGLMDIGSKSCWVTEDGCQYVDLPDVTIDTQPERSSTALTSLPLSEDTQLEIRFQAVTHWRSSGQKAMPAQG